MSGRLESIKPDHQISSFVWGPCLEHQTGFWEDLRCFYMCQATHASNRQQTLIVILTTKGLAARWLKLCEWPSTISHLCNSDTARFSHTPLGKSGQVLGCRVWTLHKITECMQIWNGTWQAIKYHRRNQGIGENTDVKVFTSVTTDCWSSG